MKSTPAEFFSLLPPPFAGALLHAQQKSARSPEITQATYTAHVTYLASDALEGGEPNQRGPPAAAALHPERNSNATA